MTSHFETTRQRLRSAGTPFYLGTESKFRLLGPDRSVVVGDPSGNLIVLLQPSMFSQTAGLQPTISGFDSKDRYVVAASRVAQAWMRTSASALSAVARDDCRWFDDTRTRTQGQQKGLASVQTALQKVYWPNYDRSRAGLQARLQVSAIRVSPQPDGAIVSYQASLSRDGLPKAGRANGYASFWVSSAQQAYDYAKKHGGQFPVIEAINNQSGVSHEPGYRQLYTTDSEGNGLVFTQY